jgi:predicted MFS family arabinose efflux permease
MTGAFRLLLIALTMFATGTDAYVLPAMLPEIARTLGVEYRAAAQIVSSYSLIYALSIIPLAIATSRWTFRTALGVGLVLFVAGCLASALAASLAVMLLARCCCGFGVAIVAPTCAAAAVAVQPPNRHGRAISIIMFSMSLAMVAGLPAGAFIAAVYGWRTTLLALGLLSAAAFVGISAVPTPWPERRQLASLHSLAADRPLQLGFATAYLGFVGVYCVYIYVGPVFDRATAASASTLSFLLWLWGLAGVAGSLAAAWLCDRLGARTLVFITLACLCLNFVALPFTSAALGSALASIVVWGSSGMMLSIALQRQLIERAPTQAAVLSALFVCALQGGIATAGGVDGALATAIEPHQLPLLGSVFLALAMLLQWFSATLPTIKRTREPA